MIRRLVGFDTTSRESNLALIDFIRNYLDSQGIASELTFDDSGRKANLFATIGPEGVGGIMLSGHTDVVPVDGQRWESDPFTATLRDERLYGRGTADMKSFIGVALAFVPEFRRHALKLPVHLAFSYDEEVGCIGVRRLIAQFAGRTVKPRACVVGEPTGMRPVTGHKGKTSMRCRVHGVESHSALAHKGVNAVEAAAELVAYLKGMARRLRHNGPHDHDFEPPYTTVHTGTIHGGTALNIVPKECIFDFEFRNLPADNATALAEEVRNFAETTLLPEMREVDPDTGFEFKELTKFPGFAIGADTEITQLALALSGANSTGKVSFGTEAGLFYEAGIPTIICGPGSIEQAHRPDEFISLDQIARCETFMRRLNGHLA